MIDCRPTKYKNDKYISNYIFCNRHCPYYKTCLEDLGQVTQSLSNNPEAVRARRRREKQKFARHDYQ